MEKKVIEQLDLMGSSSCDLKCSYCYITKNCSFFDYDRKIKEAWKSGNYIQVIKDTFKKLDQDLNNITDLQLWGGEPTLHMVEIATQAKALGSLCPNVTQFLIPTNWFQTNVSALLDFIYGLDESINERNLGKNPLNFHIQASIDGPPGDFNKYGHAVNWDIYKKNFDKFCDELETRGQLKNIVIVFAVCGTATQELILKNFNTYDQICEFKEFITKVTQYVDNRLKTITNASIHLSSYLWTPRIAISQTTTTEEAVNLEKIIRMLEYYNHENKVRLQANGDELNLFHNVLGEGAYVHRNHECPESNETAITLMPDGTIVECPCTFLQNLESYQQEILDSKDYWEYKSTLIRLPNFYNPLSEDEDESKKTYHDWYVFGGGYLGTQSTYANLNLSMAYEMALSHQIDPKYARDPDLLIKHHMADFMSTECYRENVNVTHNHFLTDHNMFRRWSNGYLEYAYDSHLSKIKKCLEFILEDNNENDTSTSR